MNLVLATNGGGMQMILMIVVFIALIYFTMMRPQRKQQEKRKNMMDGLKPGDKVVTIGRLHGVVDKIDRESQTVSLDCDGVFLTFDLSAIGRVEVADQAAKPADSKEAK